MLDHDCTASSVRGSVLAARRPAGPPARRGRAPPRPVAAGCVPGSLAGRPI